MTHNATSAERRTAITVATVEAAASACTAVTFVAAPSSTTPAPALRRASEARDGSANVQCTEHSRHSRRATVGTAHNAARAAERDAPPSARLPLTARSSSTLFGDAVPLAARPSRPRAAPRDTPCVFGARADFERAANASAGTARDGSSGTETASSGDDTSTGGGARRRRAQARRSENVPGNLYIAEPCISCDVCRWMVPDVFQYVNGKTAVVKQPESRDEQFAALQAAAACPVGTIRTESPPPPELGRAARASFPIPVLTPSTTSIGGDGDANGDAAAVSHTPSIYHNGFHSADSFGATSYLVLPAGEQWRHAAILVDSPRYFRPLVSQIEALLAREQRQLTHMFLTHIDDVADHAKWCEHFSEMRRIMHMDDRQFYGDSELDAVEIPLHGSGPWYLTPDTIAFANDNGGSDGGNQSAASTDASAGAAVKIVHTPGHTPGSSTMIVNGTAAMTGDHMAYLRALQSVGGFPHVCWYDWQMVIDSVRKLADERWTWCLPGHARRYRFESVEDMRRGVRSAAARMESDEWWSRVPAAARHGARRRQQQRTARTG